MLHKKEIFVEKRDGRKVPYDVMKIKQSIAHAVDSTGANGLELEASLDEFIKNNIKTSAIQESVILAAKRLANLENPEWLNVAGRAYAANMWADYPLRDKSFFEILKYNIKKKEYSQELLDFYNESDIELLGQYINQDRDLDHSYSSLLTGHKKYLGKYELNQHMHMVNAMRFCQYEPEETRLSTVKEVYDVLSKRKLSLATPFMSNLRKGGNVASCFILALEDDLDSISDNWKRIAKISKNGGGIGIFLGFIRAAGSMVGGVEGAAGNLTQWVKPINDILVAVNQGGKRKGAGTVALPIWHNDIQEFLDMQTEHGDLRLKSFDVFPQVTIPDIFMKRDKENKSWTTFCPYEVRVKLGIDVRGLYGKDFESAYEKIEIAAQSGKLKVTKTYSNARDLTKMIMKTHFSTGLPYISFIDEMNRRNPNKGHSESYGILCANLCVESYSNVVPDKYGHVCNLASINLGNIDSLGELAYVSKLATKVLNYGIKLTNSPDPVNTAHNEMFCTIGIGVMGLHDYLVKNKMTYENLDEIEKISEIIELNAARQSVELAKKYGSFLAFPESDWANGEQTKHFASHSKNPEVWYELQKDIDMYGIRNSQLTSPAPTTSTSIYQEASATFLPVYDLFYDEGNKNGDLPVAAKFLKEFPNGYGLNVRQRDAKEIIDVAERLQRFIDTGISMELMFDQNKPDFKAKDLYDAIHYAFDKGLKTIYYIRGVKKNESLEVACEGCTG
jgi:ribonucleoside-diphosphate reductase alpha chain